MKTKKTALVDMIWASVDAKLPEPGKMETKHTAPVNWKDLPGMDAIADLPAFFEALAAVVPPGQKAQVWQAVVRDLFEAYHAGQLSGDPAHAALILHRATVKALFAAVSGKVAGEVAAHA